MGPGAVLLVFAIITGVMIFLAVQQSRIKKQIEEMHRNERPDMFPPGDPTTLPPTSGSGDMPILPHAIGPESGGAPISGPGPGATPPSHGSHDISGGHHGGDSGFSGGDAGGGGHH